MKYRSMLSAIVLMFFSFIIAVQRLYTYYEPLERDLTLYAVIGHEFLLGRSFYSDLCENKPPAIFLTYAAAEVIAGYGESSIYFLGVIAAVITLLGVYCVGYSLSNSHFTGLMAALFWTVICSDLFLQANQPNTEVFINACIIWAFAFLLCFNNKNFWLRRFLIIGGLLVIASLYKPVAIAIAAALSAIHITFPLGDPPDRCLALKQFLAMALMGWLVWISLFIYFIRLCP